MHPLYSASSAPIKNSASLASLGTINCFGVECDPMDRIERSEDFFVIDSSRVVRAIDLGDERTVWTRVPGFIRSNKQLLGYPGRNICLIDDLRFYNLYKENSGWPILYDLTAECAVYLGGHPEAFTDFKLLDDSYDKFDWDIHCEHLETLIVNQHFEEAWDFVEDSSLRPHANHPRFQFAIGALGLKAGRYFVAKRAFHQAQQMGHPDGFKSELIAWSKATQNFREENFLPFGALDRGNRTGALIHLRALRKKDPILANGPLAYCLRGTPYDLEGIEVCYEGLMLDGEQADLYGHLWSFLTERENDSEALRIAQDHIRLYPEDLSALTNGIDSALLLGKETLAKYYSHAYLTRAVNLNSALYNLFKVFEPSRNWTQLNEFFLFIVPLMRACTPRTLYLQGEILLELGEMDPAFEYLERAMRAAPEDAQTLLAYGRALGRAGRYEEAIQFISTVVADKNRDDDIGYQTLFLKLLSELLRYQGRSQEALAVWPNRTQFSPSFLSAVGPQPFVEYAICLYENGYMVEARQVLNLVEQKFPRERSVLAIVEIMK
ncbi:MAG: tetratricopeptide repeat protein [Bdellovibrionales bacterium]|nr:tetratricopeptide repeat protein [Bdellovibrionales bacterium]